MDLLHHNKSQEVEISLGKAKPFPGSDLLSPKSLLPQEGEPGALNSSLESRNGCTPKELLRH